MAKTIVYIEKELTRLKGWIFHL